MKAYILETDKIIEPFNEPCGLSMILNQPLVSYQIEVLESAGLEPKVVKDISDLIDPPFLLVMDYTFFTRETINLFLNQVAPKKNAGLALEKGPVISFLDPLKNLTYKKIARSKVNALVDIYHISHINWSEDCANWQDLVSQLKLTCFKQEIPTPKTYRDKTVVTCRGITSQQIPFGEVLAGHLDHWLNLLLVNPLLCRYRLRANAHRTKYSLFRLTEKLGRGSIVAKGCDIHPTAYIENSFIGDGVKLGAFTSVRNSWIGDNSVLNDHSRIKNSVIGENCHILSDSYLVDSVSYPDSTIANFMLRQSLVGRGVFITSGVIFIDNPLHHHLAPSVSNKNSTSEFEYCGGCVGHQAILGTRSVFLPGSKVGNQWMVVMRPEEGVYKIPSGLENIPLTWHQGQLIPKENKKEASG